MTTLFDTSDNWKTGSPAINEKVTTLVSLYYLYPQFYKNTSYNRMIAPVSFNSLAFYFLIVCDVIVDGGCGVNDFEVIFFLSVWKGEKKTVFYSCNNCCFNYKSASRMISCQMCPHMGQESIYNCWNFVISFCHNF